MTSRNSKLLMIKCVVTVVMMLFAQNVNSSKIECDDLVIKDSRIMHDIGQFLSGYYDSGAVNIRCIIGCNGWFIAEIESKDFEPVIAVISKSKGAYSVKAEWGGMVEDGDAKVVIRRYFKQKAPGLPSKLLKCFKPTGPPFVMVK